jgi:hypothetical protein
VTWSEPAEETTVWPPWRQAVAAAAIVAAALTGLAGAALGNGGWAETLAAAHLAATAAVLRRPTLAGVQVAVGVGLAWLTLPGSDDPNPAVVPVITGVVATAELLGLSARLGTVVSADAVPGLLRVGVTAIGAAAVSGLVVAMGGLGDMGGLPATAVAAGACLAVIALVAIGPSGPRP